jgi:hypothetical protein
MTTKGGRSSSLGVPAHAIPAYVSLLNAIAEAGATPCAASPDTWTSERADERDAATRACLDCEAFVPCRRYADVAGETHGVWGGADMNPALGRRRKVA